MKQAQITSLSDTTTGLRVKLFEKGTGGAPDTLISEVTLDGTTSTVMPVLTPDRYVLIQDGDDTANKSVDNW